jgi:hypothetical protein
LHRSLLQRGIPALCKCWIRRRESHVLLLLRRDGGQRRVVMLHVQRVVLGAVVTRRDTGRRGRAYRVPTDERRRRRGL